MAYAYLWRYELPSIKGEGWAAVVVGSDGFFAAVSDYGNYAFRWTHHGCKDFREFLLGAERSPDYFIDKLSNKPWPYDGPATLAAVRSVLEQWRKDGTLTSDEIRAEEILIEEYNDLEHEIDFWDWCRNTERFETADEFHVTAPPNDVVAFVKKVMPRLAVLLRGSMGKPEKGERDVA